MTPIQQAYHNYMQRCHVSATPRAALFDMDGTLYNSMPGHVEAWTQMLSEVGISVTPREILMTEGRTGADTIRRLFAQYLGREADDELCRRLYARKSELFAALPPVEVMPGAQQLVESVLSRGLITVLVTGSAQNTLLDRLEQDFPGAFPPERRVTARNVTNGKPHPEPFLRGMAIAGVKPCQALAFDNAPLGVQSASEAGAVTFGVVTGDISPSALAEAGADIVFESMPQCARAFRT